LSVLVVLFLLALVLLPGIREAESRQGTQENAAEDGSEREQDHGARVDCVGVIVPHATLAIRHVASDFFVQGVLLHRVACTGPG
jgi:hypothetical protein